MQQRLGPGPVLACWEVRRLGKDLQTFQELVIYNIFLFTGLLSLVQSMLI